MKSLASILALFALSAVAIADQDINSASARRDFTCETSSSSPLLSDVQRVYDRLISRGQQRCSVASGSSCTQIQTSGTAAVDVCGPSGWYTDCYNAGRYVRQLADTCKVDMDGTTKVGGIYRYGDGKGYLTVYHT